MPKYLVLPKIGMNMEEGVITEWLVKPGDRVEKEQMVVVAETDKAEQEIFATESGIVYKLLAQPGDTVPCQERIAILLDEGETPPDEEPERMALAAAPETVHANTDVPVLARATASPAVSCKGLRISPLAKKMARELHIPLESLKPQKEGARIVKADVLRAKAQKDAMAAQQAESSHAGSDETIIPLTNKRKVIAKRMRESVAEKPRVCHVLTVDCEELYKWRETLKKTKKVTYNELIMKACAVALEKYPELNILTADGGYVRKDTVNIGVAVDHPKGLLVPVIKNVERKGIFQLAVDFAELTAKAKEGKLSLDEMSGATFTISNLGMFEIESFDPIINVPECLILGVGAMREVPAVVDGQIQIRKRMKLCLSFDHAVIDGAPAARLLQEIKHLLEEPLMMLA